MILHIATYYSSPVRQLNTDILQHFDTLSNTIITGDLNAHHTYLQDSNDNPKCFQLVQFLAKSKQQILEIPGPTRVPNIGQNPTSPDIILTRHNLHKHTHNCYTLPPLNTDHCPVYFEIQTPQWIATQPDNYRTIEDYINADWTTYQQYITTTLPEINPTNIQEIDTADSTLENIIQQARNIAIPTKRIKTYYGLTLPPNIIHTIKMKRQAHRNYTRTH